MLTIEQAIFHATQQLTTTSESPVLDSELLLSHCLDKTRTYLVAHNDTLMQPEQQQQFDQLISQRMSGKPIAYILNTQEFWSLKLFVDNNVLIPRPDTECVVEYIMEHVDICESSDVLDLGTGSGAIAIALSVEKPSWKITATDYSLPALQVAQKNAGAHLRNNISFCHSNWFNEIPTEKRFNLIVSNPPYIAENDTHLSGDGVAFEPRTALVANNNGYADIELIAIKAPQYLTKLGYLVIEHGYEQGEKTRGIFRCAGFENISTQQDLTGNDRFTVGQLI